MDEKAPNVPELADSGHHRWSPYELVRSLLPGSKAAGSFEIDLNFAERIAVTLGAINAQTTNVTKNLQNLNKLVIANMDPPFKNEWLYLPAATTDYVRMHTEAGERWLLDTIWHLAADGTNPAATLMITAGMPGGFRVPCPAGSFEIKESMRSPINLAFTSTGTHDAVILCQFRREYRYEEALEGDGNK